MFYENLKYRIALTPYPSLFRAYKALGHWLQGNIFSQECVLKCLFKYPLSEKALGHWLQGNRFSPECVLKCAFN